MGTRIGAITGQNERLQSTPSKSLALLKSLYQESGIHLTEKEAEQLLEPEGMDNIKDIVFQKEQN